MKKNKRGVSDVVTTVLIVMLTVAAVGVIAGFVVPFVKNSLQKSTECTDYKEFYTFDESLGFNCKTGNTYTFSVKAASIGTGKSNFSVGTGKNATNYTISADRALVENVAGMKLILTRPDGTTKSADIMNGSAVTTEIKMYGGDAILTLPGPSGIKSYNYNSSDEFVSAEVYPILKNNRICADIKESINIRKSCLN